MPDITLKTHEIEIIDFNELFVKTIQNRIIDDLYSFELLEKSINNTNVKKFIIHHVIFETCEKVLSKNNKSIIYFNNTQLEECELMKYFTETEILTFLSNLLRKIEKLLPIKFYISKFSLEYLNCLSR